MFRLVPASILSPILGFVAYSIWYACLVIHKILQTVLPGLWPQQKSPYAGKTVLVTTGRQAKTLHSVRALKEIGCRVIVTDYQEMSASKVSTSCDAYYTLAPLDASKVHVWFDKLEQIIRKENVDIVIPMSTINEALFVGVAKDWFKNRLPNVQFFCEGLGMMAGLDNKANFSKMCSESGVPVPEDGVISSRAELENDVPWKEMDIIVKRLESTINRAEEIKFVPKGSPLPSVQPTEKDPWQWQRLINGKEYSAWFVVVNGKITFQACYVSLDDLLFFDGVPVPDDVQSAIARFVAKYKLTGQYAFDYFREENTGKFYVIECNPRTHSPLECTSSTPGWGRSFFGEDMRSGTVNQNVGFWFHRNCWPFTSASSRSEAFWNLRDPLPFFVGELAWPLELLRIKGALKGGYLPRIPKNLPQQSGDPLTALFPGLFEALGLNYHHLDVNIGKVIVPGPTGGREFAFFEDMEKDMRKAFVQGQVQLCGQTPRVLCMDADVANAVTSTDKSQPVVTRVVEEPAELQRSAKSGPKGVSTIPGSPQDTLANLAQQNKSFDLIFLKKQYVEALPKGILAAGGRAIAVETLPQGPVKSK